MYKLYYYPCNASLAPHFVLQQLGVDFELLLVDRKAQGQKSAEYMALNPAGRIPTLIDGDLVVFEAAAICLHLAETMPEAKLMPPVGHPERAKCHQWLMYLTNTLQAELMIYYYPAKHCINESHCEDIVAAQKLRIAESLALLDDQLAGKDYLVGESLSICDHYLMMLAIWADEIDQPPMSFAHLGRYLRQLVQQPTIKAVCSKENINLDIYQ